MPPKHSVRFPRYYSGPEGPNICVPGVGGSVLGGRRWNRRYHPSRKSAGLIPCSVSEQLLVLNSSCPLDSFVCGRRVYPQVWTKMCGGPACARCIRGRARASGTWTRAWASGRGCARCSRTWRSASCPTCRACRSSTPSWRTCAPNFRGAAHCGGRELWRKVHPAQPGMQDILLQNEQA